MADIQYATVENREKRRTRVWANAQRDGRPAEYKWRPLAAQCCKVWLTPTPRVPYSNVASIRERKTWTQSEFCTWWNSGTGQEPPKMETAKHRARFGWLPLSDVAAVTKPRRETRWNLLGCPKLTNWPQPLVGRSSPYCEDMGEILLFNKFLANINSGSLSLYAVARPFVCW